MQLSLKLTYLPLLVFRSLDPEHATHANFYRSLYAFASPTLPKPSSSPTLPTPQCVVAPTSSGPGDADRTLGCVECEVQIDGQTGVANSVTTPTAASADIAAAATATNAEKARQEARQLADLRVCAINAYLSHARSELPQLLERLEGIQGQEERALSATRASPYATRARSSGSDSSGTVPRQRMTPQLEVEAWARAVGHSGSGGRGTLERRLLELLHEKEDEMIDEAEAATALNATADSAAQLRASMRATVLKHEVGAAASKAEHWLSYRSESLPWLLSLMPWLPGERPALPPSAHLFASGALDALLQLGAASCLVAAAPLLAAWAAVSAALLVLGLLFPLLQPALLLARGDTVPALPATLCCCYVACVVGLASLAPSVRAFHRLRADLVSAKGFPKEFYSEQVLHTITTRVEAAVHAAASKATLGAPPMLRFGDDCTICLRKIVTSNSTGIAPRRATTELLCGHSFHAECVAEWLEVHASCPNCRSPAHVDLALERAARDVRAERAARRVEHSVS